MSYFDFSKPVIRRKYLISLATVQTGSQDGAGASEVQQSNNHSLTGSARQDWVQQTIKASSQDVRRQPWKKLFANTVESRIDDSPDLVVVKKPQTAAAATAATTDDDDDEDSSCPFQIQGSSLAA